MLFSLGVVKNKGATPLIQLFDKKKDLDIYDCLCVG